MRAGIRRAILVMLMLAAAAPQARAASQDGNFDALSHDFLGEWLARRPQAATRLGDHSHDSELYAITPQSVASDLEWLREMQELLAAIPREKLSFERQLDRDVLASRIEREILELSEVRSWARNPNTYVDLVSSPIQALLQRDFAPLCNRIQSATRRLRAVPEILRAAPLNLDHPPTIYTEIAIAQLDGVLTFYRVTLGALTAECREPRLQADLAEADTAAVKAVEAFRRTLKDEVLARSDSSFALGASLYARKLAADEMDRTPLDTLLAQAWRELEATDARMKLLAERIAPGGGVQAALDSLAQGAPSESQLVPAVSGELDAIRAFLRKKDLLTMPSRENLIVRETPPFRRSLSFASMDAPGVWDKNGTQAYYNVTPVDPAWSAQQKRDHLAFFNRWSAALVSIHEALPGHYYQYLANRNVPFPIRQAFGSASGSEGWAHYCEQMAIEAGFGDGDPRYEFAQLYLAMQRLGRFVVGISLHTKGMTYDEAVTLFEERCYMPPVNAAREARRGTSDPTYLVYTLGKWRILALREECRTALGDRFSLRDFNDAVVAQGPVAAPVLRAAVLRALGVRAPRPPKSR